MFLIINILVLMHSMISSLSGLPIWETSTWLLAGKSGTAQKQVARWTASGWVALAGYAEDYTGDFYGVRDGDTTSLDNGSNQVAIMTKPYRSRYARSMVT